MHTAWSRRYCLPAAEQLKAFDVAEALERNVRKRDLKPTKSDLLSSVRAASVQRSTAIDPERLARSCDCTAPHRV